MKCKYLIASIVLFAFGYRAQAQAVVVNEQYTAQQLAETILDTNCEVQISNAVITGYNGPGGTSYGYYSYDPDEFPEDWPLQNGIVLSSGYSLEQLNTSGSWDMDFLGTGSTDTSWPGDADITNALGGTTSYNATVLEFDVVPSINYISFTFSMPSAEYYSFLDNAQRGCSYNDGIAVLIKPADNSLPYQNLALIPNTTLPISNGTLNYFYDECLQNVNNSNNMNAFGFGLITAGYTVTPGATYHIKIGVTDGADAKYDTAILVAEVVPDYTINLGNSRLHEFYDPLCPGEVLTVTSKPGAVAYKWYKNDGLIAGETASAYTITQPGTYTSVATMPNGCDYTGEIVIEYNAPIDNTPLTYYQCDEDGDGFTAYYIPQVGEQVLPDGLQPLYYYHTLADVNNNNPIQITPTPQLYYNVVPNEQVYAKVQNQYGCQQIIPIILSVTPPVNPVLPGITGCPDVGQAGGFATFNLALYAIDIVQGFPAGTTATFFTTEAEALLGLSPLPALYTNSTPGGGTLYVRLANSQGCYGIGTVQLTIVDFGPGLPDEQVALCPGETATLNAGAGFQSYLWDTQQTSQNITVTEPGIYSVEVTNAAGCIRIKTFTVFPSQAPQAIDFEITDFNGGHNSITVAAQGNGSYEYSLDGIHYQPDTIFENLQPGQYTIYVRDANGCGPLLTDDTVILDYPTFFSPNGDGVNDTWRIPFMQLRPGMLVSVFDRYGKFILAFNGISPGWDGTLGGKPLPATDYWFSLSMENGRVVKGHFSLLR